MKTLFAFCLTFSTLYVYATSPKAAYEMVKKGEAVMVDVREKHEIDDGMIKGATWFPKSKVDHDEDWLQEFQKLTANKKIFLYCRTGNRSGQVMRKLQRHGIDSENLGGYEELKHELPISRP